MQLKDNPISAYLEGPKRRERAERRRAGRPRKETPEFYASLLDGFARLAEWFQEENGQLPRSDAELVAFLRSHMLAGRRFSRREDAELAEALLSMRTKTLLNALGRARRYFRESPENMPITGMDRIACGGSNFSKDVRERHERN